MSKRIAYIGLSYPLLYDYKNQAPLTQNDLSDSPNPIIESPLGLMILYDELWFLCESMCPFNMRNLSYVKFVDKMFPDLYFEGVYSFRENIDLQLDESLGLSYGQIVRSLNLSKEYTVDTHTHGIQIGDVKTSANGGKDNFIFDLYVFIALQERCTENIELVSNSRFCMKEFTDYSDSAKVVEKLIISDIPNYLSKEGPYHSCFEELRENKYLVDFRKWIIENHNTIQKNEITEMCNDVNQIIKDTQDRVFLRYLEDNNKYAFSKSTGKTILQTGIGIVSAPFSIADALLGIAINGKNMVKANGNCWQGFVISSRRAINANFANDK